MAERDNAERLVRIAHSRGYNEVDARQVDGGVVVELDHRGTSDEACYGFIPADRIVFMYGDERGEWEDVPEGGDYVDAPVRKYVEQECPRGDDCSLTRGAEYCYAGEHGPPLTLDAAEIDALADLAEAAFRHLTPAQGSDGFNVDTLRAVVAALRVGRDVVKDKEVSTP